MLPIFCSRVKGEYAMSKNFTDQYIKNLKPDPKKQYQVFDAKETQLCLRVNPKGTKTFSLNYRINGKQRRKKIGRYPEISLAEARNEARKLKGEIAKGVDPSATQAENDIKFNRLLEDYINRYAQNNTKLWKETERILKREFLPFLKNKDVKDITRADLVECINKIVDRGAMTMATQAHRAISKLFNWSVEQGILEMSPYAGAAQPAKNNDRERFLSDEELRKVWKSSREVNPQYEAIIKLLILTGQRLNEVCGMRYEDLNFEDNIWSIPASMTKSKKKHEVPLTRTAMEVIKVIPRTHQVYVFPARGKNRPTTCSSKWKKQLDDISGVSDWKQHDLRRTVSTGMARSVKILPHVIEKVLNHSTGVLGGIAGVYNRSKYEEEKLGALQRWEEYILGNITLKILDLEP